MKRFVWNEEKNRQLKSERGISFEMIVSQIEAGKMLDIVRNPNQAKYQDQMMFIIELDSYAFLVPFSEDENEIFLITVIPSRKATKRYLGG
ncbi:MAG: BrnT family toxin [Candidatus Krumholzibacteria bacterium]|nr:BrnT family toxin [Candidatus Krumholzibacteria bacterium]